jgi:hypothetical protein
VTEDLRALLRADLNAERPPPLGDVVGAAIRDGRRIRRKRRFLTIGAGSVIVTALAAAAVLLGDGPVAGRFEQAAVVPPQTVPIEPAAPTDPPRARTLTIHSGTERADGLRRKATSAAMLHLLTLLLPPGRTSHYGVASDDDLHVQLYLDDGNGPAMVRVSLAKLAAAEVRAEDSPRGAGTTVTIQHMPGNCVQSTVVDAEWPDGTLVQVDVATCLPVDGVRHKPTRPALTADQAIRVATDPRWGVMMDERLVRVGAQEFPERLPVFS